MELFRRCLLICLTHCGGCEKGLWPPGTLEAAFKLHLSRLSFSKPVCVLSGPVFPLLREVWCDHPLLLDPEEPEGSSQGSYFVPNVAGGVLIPAWVRGD